MTHEEFRPYHNVRIKFRLKNGQEFAGAVIESTER